jgi:hypothetical protein
VFTRSGAYREEFPRSTTVRFTDLLGAFRRNWRGVLLKTREYLRLKERCRQQARGVCYGYVGLAEQNASAVVISQTWTEVHRVNSRVRDALKAKGLLGANDTTVQVLERLDLTNAQKRDGRFYPQVTVTVIVFNQKVREAKLGAKGKLAGVCRVYQPSRQMSDIR